MKYIEGWFIKAFGSELHVEQIIYDRDNELSKKQSKIDLLSTNVSLII